MKKKRKKSNYDATGKLMLYGLISFCIGVPSFFIALPQTKNYLHPNLFVFSISLIGLIVALLISFKFKNRPIKDPTDSFIHYFSTIILSMGCIGILLLIISLLNKNTSIIKSCDNFVVINKVHIAQKYRKPEQNCIYVVINHKKWEFLSTHKYWNAISVHQKVTICKNESWFHFDYLTLKEN